MSTQFKIRVINETVLDDISTNEANQIAEMIASRFSIPTFIGNVAYTYTEIEEVCSG